VKKNDQLLLSCVSLGSNMEGICKHDNLVVFVPGMLPGETALVLILKVLSKYAYGRILTLNSKPSASRASSDCESFPSCGGCSCRHMLYEDTLIAKQNMVQHCLHSIAHMEIAVQPVIGMENPYHYRNKASFPIGGTAEDPVIGFYAQRSHRIISCSKCQNAETASDNIIQSFLAWIKRNKVAPYNEVTGTGILRHIVIRTNYLGQSLVTVVINQHSSDILRSFVPELEKNHVIGLVANYNLERTNVILGKHYETVYGASTISDKIGEIEYQISPASFFQVNRIQTKKLYDTVKSYAQLTSTDILADVYCGIGTISLYLARECKYVTGIEIVPQAIQNAIINAKQNEINNVHFQCAPAQVALPQLVQNGFRPNVIVVDPPRKGLDSEVIQSIGSALPDRIVYVSCNPATLARDLSLLQQYDYMPEKVQPVDMFCWTSDVETICLLSRNKSI